MFKVPPHDIHNPSLPAGNGTASGPRRRPRHVGSGHLLWIMIPLVYAMVGWSLAGERWAGDRPQQIVEVAGISLVGAVGVFLAFYVRSRNIQIERAYSAHLEELSQRLRSLAYHDSLTELYGHLMGDKLLAFIGRIISDQVRGADIAARYGGDEFAIILPDTPQAAAEATAQKLARAIASGQTNAGLLSESLPPSPSCGVACCPDEARSVSELLQLADGRLYAAKDGSLPPYSHASMR